ncbi:hypothetical protein [Salinisphaera orenii]|uniref:hypothetical protein n=1 Tax=Salinisphaera orenii TaxID=856731 RepID=UPI000DBE9954
MSRKRWKKVQPQSMSQALRLSLDWAEHKHNRSVKRVADLNGVTEWTIYKWMSDGSIPSKRIPSFELACGAHFVTGFLAGAACKLIIDIPDGRDVGGDDLLDLQNQLNTAVNQLHQYYQDEGEAASAITASEAGPHGNPTADS